MRPIVSVGVALVDCVGLRAAVNELLGSAVVVIVVVDVVVVDVDAVGGSGVLPLLLLFVVRFGIGGDVI